MIKQGGGGANEFAGISFHEDVWASTTWGGTLAGGWQFYAIQIVLAFSTRSTSSV